MVNLIQLIHMREYMFGKQDDKDEYNAYEYTNTHLLLLQNSMLYKIIIICLHLETKHAKIT